MKRSLWLALLLAAFLVPAQGYAQWRGQSVGLVDAVTGSPFGGSNPYPVTCISGCSGGGGGSSDVNLIKVGGTTISLGQAAMAASFPVAIASDQGAFTVNLGTISTAATAAAQTTGNTSLATIATNTTGVATAANQTTGNTTLSTIDTDIKATQPRTVFKTNNAAATPSVCGSTATATPSTAADTLLVEISGSTDIYVCEISASSNGANNFYLESAAAAGCTSTLAQLGNTWYTTQYWAKAASNPFYRGVHVGAGKGLCVHTSAAQALSVTVYYDQY